MTLHPDDNDLIIPDWVPPAVADKARQYYRERDIFGFGDYRPVIQRLINQPRMRFVWRELSKRRRTANRSTNSFYYRPNIPDYICSGNLKARHDAAMAMIFRQAATFAVHGTSFLLRPKPHPKTNEWDKLAEQIRDDAKEIRHHGGDEWADRLEYAAFVYDELALNPVTRSGRSLFVEGGRGDLEARGLAVVMASILKNTFHAPKNKSESMYGVVASLCSAALGREVGAPAVREWCRGVWGKNLANRQ